MSTCTVAFGSMPKIFSDFEKAFPHKPVAHYLAKVSPVPMGATHENLRVWLDTQSVKGKPIRALNATMAIVNGRTVVQTVPYTQTMLRP